MTTDPTPLQERIARALDPSSWRLHDSGPFPPEHEASRAVIRRSMDDAAAVLPIIRNAERAAAREALDGYADALNRNRSAAVWDWPDFVGDVREWASYNYPEETP